MDDLLKIDLKVHVLDIPARQTADGNLPLRTRRHADIRAGENLTAGAKAAEKVEMRICRHCCSGLACGQARQAVARRQSQPQKRYADEQQRPQAPVDKLAAINRNKATRSICQKQAARRC